VIGGKVQHNTDPRHGPTCPKCGERKALNSQQCMKCRNVERQGAGEAPFFDQTGIYSDDAVYAVGRREALITFARDGKTRTVRCFGTHRVAQVEDGRAQLPGDGWKVVSRSTPTTTLADLRVGEMNERDLAHRVRRNRELSAL
jgi:hypothetical protein